MSSSRDMTAESAGGAASGQCSVSSSNATSTAASGVASGSAAYGETRTTWSSGRDGAATQHTTAWEAELARWEELDDQPDAMPYPSLGTNGAPWDPEAPLWAFGGEGESALQTQGTDGEAGGSMLDLLMAEEGGQQPIPGEDVAGAASVWWDGTPDNNNVSGPRAVSTSDAQTQTDVVAEDVFFLPRNWVQCPVCLGIPSRATQTFCCGAAFCFGCVLQAVATGNGCPMCRAPLAFVMDDLFLDRLCNFLRTI